MKALSVGGNGEMKWDAMLKIQSLQRGLEVSCQRTDVRSDGHNDCTIQAAKTIRANSMAQHGPKKAQRASEDAGLPDGDDRKSLLSHAGLA